MDFLVIDTESAWDQALHQAYLVVEPGLNHHRRPCRRMFAAAAFDLSLSDSGVVTINGLASWTERDWGSDIGIAAVLFDHIRFRPDHQVVTWSGLSAELPLLTLTAMEAGMVLPPQLRTGQRLARGEMRPHRDLALEMKAQGRDWAHVSEILIRLGVPPALLARKAELQFPQSETEWQEARSHVELDTALTAMVLLAWLASQGTPGIRNEPTMAHLASWFLRERSPSSQQRLGLEALYAEMAARIEFEGAEAA